MVVMAEAEADIVNDDDGEETKGASGGSTRRYLW
jgi:hypothetical protein